MDGWLKALVATACVVIIAGGAYAAWSGYRSSQAADAARVNAAVERCQEAAQIVNEHARREGNHSTEEFLAAHKQATACSGG
jgi:predicted negative regulator of RcsB-dependent stress response